MMGKLCAAMQKRICHLAFLIGGYAVCCHAEKDLAPNIFDRIKAYHIFMNKCMVLNGTLAWDVAGGRNVNECVDIDPLYLHELEKSKERIA